VPGDYRFMPFWALFFVASLVAAGFLLGNMSDAE
jgi:hypothetical protein